MNNVRTSNVVMEMIKRKEKTTGRDCALTAGLQEPRRERE